MADNTDQVTGFANDYGPLADDISQQTGLDRNLVLGHMAEESGWNGISNNPFGISDANGNKLKYDTVQQGAQAYINLMNGKRYGSIAHMSDPDDQAHAFQSLGYNVTDKNYGDNVANLAKQFRDNQLPVPPIPPDQPPADQNDEIRKFAQQTADPNYQAPTTPSQPNPGLDETRKFAEQTSTAPDATPSPSNVDESTLGSLKAGAIRGVDDMIDNPQWALAKIGDATGISSRLGFRNADQIAADNKAAVDKYNQDYGDNPLAGISRFGTQAAGTTAAIMAGGGLLTLTGRGLATLAPEAAEALAPVARFIAGRGGTGTIGRGASLVTDGAGQGAAASAITSGQDPNTSILKQTAEGAGVGAVAAPALKVIGRGIGSVVGAGASTSPEIADLANKAKNTYGIPLTASQITDNPTLKNVVKGSDATVFSGADRSAQLPAFQKAIGQQIGEPNVTNFTPDVMKNAADRIGKQMDDVASRTSIDINNDPKLLSDLAKIESDAKSGAVPLAAGGERSIQSNIDRILDSASQNNGKIPGDVYQKMTQTGSVLDRASNAGDVHTQAFNKQIMDALDNAFQRAASPQDQAALTQARSQYRALKTIEPLAAASPTGVIDPKSLMGRVMSQSRRFDNGTNGVAYQSDNAMSDLAKIGKQFEIGGSHGGPVPATIGNLLSLGGANGLIEGVGLAGGLGHLPVSHPAISAAVAAGGITGNRGLNTWLNSPKLAQNVIKNGLAGSPKTGVSTILSGTTIPTMTIKARQGKQAYDESQADDQ